MVADINSSPKLMSVEVNVRWVYDRGDVKQTHCRSEIKASEGMATWLDKRDGPSFFF